MLKEEDDYWERKSEKYTEYPKPLIKDVDRAFEELQLEPRMFRSGVTDFKNNRNFLRVEQWEEYDDGSLVKKIVQDDSYGKK